MKILTLPVGKEKTNCYIVVNDADGNKGIVIDPGDNPSAIIKTIDDNGVVPQVILATHGDTDQVMAADLVQQHYDIPFYINKNDEGLLAIIPSMSGFASGEYQRLSAPSKISYIEEGEAQFAGFTIKVFLTSGHTKGSVSYYFKDFAVVCSGDVIQNSDKQSSVKMGLNSMIKYMSSIKRILDLPENTRIYPSHSNAFTVSDARLKWSDLLKY